MDQRRVTNALLFVIAVCLVLIVVHLYGLEITQPVEAQQGTMPNRVELVYKNSNGQFYPIVDGSGRIYTVSSQK